MNPEDLQLDMAQVLDWRARSMRKRARPPQRYWDEYVATDEWYVSKMLEDVPQHEIYAACMDENFESDKSDSTSVSLEEGEIFFPPHKRQKRSSSNDSESDQDSLDNFIVHSKRASSTTMNRNHNSDRLSNSSSSETYSDDEISDDASDDDDSTG
mmetsp:Transcript_28850/g.63204  ORF Transcript_28850/g.63204 Transcript_28850/m.63204 type:complete len:155 (-) Transcript_28850:617-1081(-)